MIQRDASIGVSVKDTIRLIAIAAAEVRPNDDMKRPMIPRGTDGMNPPHRQRGRMTEPLSFVPSTAARIASCPLFDEP